jgi:two-component system, sensor histidine kinase RegB
MAKSTHTPGIRPAPRIRYAPGRLPASSAAERGPSSAARPPRCLTPPGPPPTLTAPVRSVSPATLSPESEPRIALAWLVRLRWGAVIGQLVTLGVAAGPLGMTLPWAPLLALVLVTAGVNAAALAVLRLRHPISPRGVGALLAIDAALLTGLLYFTGGPSNPFSVLYLVHVTLAAVILPTGWSVFLGLLALAGYGLLFFRHVPLAGMEHIHHGGSYSLHLQGMWVAFAVSAALISWCVAGVRAALRSRDEELARSRERTARYERLAAVGTLAAGAAHELGTPLGTIAVAARELERALEAGSPPHEDARLIREQVDRCQRILRQLRDQASEAGGEEFAPAPLADVLEEVLAGLPPERRGRVRVELPTALERARLPRQATGRMLGNLLGNAFDASAPEAPVQLRVLGAPGAIEFHVVDQGAGMAPEVLARVGEPFFTTKEPGRGMGLGLHLVRTVAEQLGGRLALDSTPGHGTRATLRLPLEGR